MNQYEIMLDVDGKSIVRTEWAVGAQDAVVMAIVNAGAESGTPGKVRVMHVGPPQAEVLRAQEQLSKQLEAATRLATSSGRRARP